jgi:hypothetical protein
VADEESAAPHPPGWDADPYGRHELRYWDGAEWTDHVSDAGVQSRDAPERMSPWAAMAAASSAAPEADTVAAPTPGPSHLGTSTAPTSATSPAPEVAPVTTPSAGTPAPHPPPPPTRPPRPPPTRLLRCLRQGWASP